MVAGGTLVLGRELCRIQAVDTVRLTVDVVRGREGTAAKAHLASIAVYYFGSGGYGQDGDTRAVTVDGYTGNLTRPTLPVGSEWTDPDTGNIYQLVDTGAAFQVGEWVVIDGAGLATQLALLSRGNVGIIVEAATASDQLAWALIVGSFAATLFDSDVTTAMQLGAAAGFAAPFDSTNHMIIARAICTVAPSTATSPTVGDGIGTAFIDRPFVDGVANFVS
jgi:hypothetical protein